MSLRPRVVVAPTPRARLRTALEAGLAVKAASDTPSTITVNGISISTDPSAWSELRVSEMVKLKLVPVDMAEFERKGAADRADPNAAYDGTRFLSLYNSDWRFFIVHLGARAANVVVYYILARPVTDANIYRPNSL